MSELQTKYPSHYVNVQPFMDDYKATQAALLQAQFDFTAHPSATNWQIVQQAMFDYQHVKLNAKHDATGKSAYRVFMLQI